jgi:hypothetical protein
MQIIFNTKEDTPEDFKKASAWLAAFAVPGAVVVTNHVHAIAPTTPAAPAAPDATPPPFAPAPAAELFTGNAAAPAAAPTPDAPPASTPSPATSAATVGQTPPPVSPGGVELDVTGLPWDARIHSLAAGNTHPKTAEGKWKLKRGVDKLTTLPHVEKELRAVMAIGAPTAAAAVPPPPATVVAPPAPPPAAAAVPPPPAAVVTPPAPPAAPGACTTMPQLMTKITDAMGAAKLTQAQVLAAVQSVGLTELPQVAHRPDLIPQIAQHLDMVILMAP